jgi:hypothetical protein
MAKSYRNVNIRVTADNFTDQDGLVLYTLADIEDNLSDWSESAGITYWFIEHPADDEVSKTHFHIVIKFKSPMPFETIKNRFPYGKIENTRNLRNSIQYLIHLNDKSKVQYSWDDIKTNCMDMSPYKVQSSAQQEITIQGIMECIDLGKIREYNQYTAIPIELWAKHKTRIENALTYYRERICMDKDRDITVIFMSGPTGIGKTTFAKRYCEARHLKPCISSSSNDPLQDYKGEPVLILDDLRDDSFKYHDFLKLLDNHTMSSSKSRYHNKPFIGDIIIITSTRPINDWYFNKTPEDKHQLYRRVREWLKFDGEKIYGFVYNEKTKRYEPACIALNPIVMEDKKRKEFILGVFDAVGVEFTPVDRQRLGDAVEGMSDNEWKQCFIPEATEEEKKARAEYDKNKPEPNWENIKKHRVG